MTLEPTIASILLKLADEYDGIVAERDVFARVLERRPSRAKDPFASIRNLLRYDSFETGWVRLGGGKLMPRHSVLRGLRFRVVPPADAIAADVLARALLEPFVLLRMPNPRLLDEHGRELNSQPQRLPGAQSGFSFASVDGQSLDGWYQRAQFQPGDSILITISATNPLTLTLQREPAAQFRAAEVASQEHELIEAIAEQIARNRTTLLPADMIVLPIVAQAEWRTAYPGRPWQQLVEADRRLRLLDNTYIADRSFRRPLDFLQRDENDESWEEEDKELLEEIKTLQAELRASRREAAERGLWDGMSPRASTGQIVFDVRAGTSQLIQPAAVNMLLDHTEAIEARVERGDFADAGWEGGDDESGDDFLPDFGASDEMFGIEDIEDMQQFMNDNPTLVEATQKLMSSLSTSEMAALNDAETPDQVQFILTKHLNKLLGREPELFAELTPELVASPNGHDLAYDPDLSDEDVQRYEQDELLTIEVTGEWEADDAPGESWEDEEDDEEESEAAARSNELMDQFYQALIAQGKSESTAASRTGDLWLYADFLANYYDRSLGEGDYATLDECLFFYYPRRVLNNSPRAVREMCTSFKQFYAFLRAEGIVNDDGFAQAIWRRRDQAARVLDLYEQLDSDSPQFERLFAYLFAPYTA